MAFGGFTSRPGLALVGGFELGQVSGALTWNYSGATSCAFIAPNPTPQVEIAGFTSVTFSTSPPRVESDGATTLAFTGGLSDYFNIAGSTTASFTGYGGGRFLCAGMTTVIFYTSSGQPAVCVVGDGKVVPSTTGGITNETY